MIVSTNVGGAGAQPQLYAPTISISGRTLIITPNSNNGSFGDSFAIYDGNTLVVTVAKSVTTVDLDDYFSTVGSYSISVKMTGEDFKDSEATIAIAYNLYSVSVTVTDGTATYDNIISNLETAVITLEADEGYILPIAVTVSGATSEYDLNTGMITLSNATENITVSVVCEEAPTIPQGYIVFESLDGTSVTLGKNGGKTWSGTLQYSTDGDTWTTWDGNASITGLKVYLRGTGNTKITGGANKQFILNGTNITCQGRIDALLDYTQTMQGISPSLSTGCFRALFYNCVDLVSSPLLPSMSVPGDGYREMFYGCISLIRPSSLPATTVGNDGYNGMYNGCIALTSIAALPALTLSGYCYENMYSGCTSIKLSQVRSDIYNVAYRIPFEGTGSGQFSSLSGMFANTGGTFVGTPTINTTYYTSNTIIPAE